MGAWFSIIFIIAKILEINVRCRSSNTNYARGRTLCSRCEFISRSRRESVVIWYEIFWEKVIILVEENSNVDLSYKKKKSAFSGEAIFVFENLVPTQQIQYSHYPLHPQGKFVNTSEGTRPINSKNVWSWLCHSRESMNMKRIFHEFMNMKRKLLKVHENKSENAMNWWI